MTMHPVLLKFVRDLSLPVFLKGPTAFLVCICLAWSRICNVVDVMGDTGTADSVSKILHI